MPAKVNPSLSLDIVPSQGIGPLRFGLTSEDIETILGVPEKTYKHNFSLSNTTAQHAWNEHIDIYVYEKRIRGFSGECIFRKNKLIEIVCFAKALVEWKGELVFRTNRAKVLEMFLREDKSVLENSECFLFLGLRMKISRPGLGNGINYLVLSTAQAQKKYVSFYQKSFRKFQEDRPGASKACISKGRKKT